MRRSICTLAAVAAALSACAPSSDEVAPRLTPTDAYVGMSCPQLDDKARGLAARAAELAGDQDDAATRDAVVMTVGLVLFWPALALLAVPDDKEELARIKGEYGAVEQVRLTKGCTAAAVAAAAAAGAPGAEAPLPEGAPRPVEGVRLAAFDAAQMRAFCGQAWTERTAPDGRTEFNPCHRPDAFAE